MKIFFCKKIPLKTKQKSAWIALLLVFSAVFISQIAGHFKRNEVSRTAAVYNSGDALAEIRVIAGNYEGVEIYLNGEPYTVFTDDTITFSAPKNTVIEIFNSVDSEITVSVETDKIFVANGNTTVCKKGMNYIGKVI